MMTASDHRYSQHARRALSQARLLAQGFHHDEVDTDHLLVGILRETSSLGRRVLLELEVDERRAELEVRVLHPVSDPLVTAQQDTAALVRVLALARDESTWFGHHYIGTEHLLLALARSRDGGAVALLRALVVSPEQIRRRVRLLLHDGVTELSIEIAKRTARLSELSRRALNAAQQVARENGSGPAGIEHLLLVLARERRSVASRILTQNGLDAAALAVQLETVAPDPVTRQAQLEDVLDDAVDRADQLGTHYTGTDHLLLALAEYGAGVTLLQACGVDPMHLITAVYRLLAPARGE